MSTMIAAVLLTLTGLGSVQAPPQATPPAADKRLWLELRDFHRELRLIEALLETARPAMIEAREREASARLQELRSSDGSRTIRVPMKATVLIHDIPAREALEALGALAGLRVQIAPDVGNASISMRMQDAYVADALHFVVNAANLTISVLDDRTIAVASK